MNLRVPVESAKGRVVGVQTNINMLVDDNNELGKKLVDLQHHFTATSGSHLADLYKEFRASTEVMYENIATLYSLTLVADKFLNDMSKISETMDGDNGNTYPSFGSNTSYDKSASAQPYSTYGSSDPSVRGSYYGGEVIDSYKSSGNVIAKIKQNNNINRIDDIPYADYGSTAGVYTEYEVEQQLAEKNNEFYGPSNYGSNTSI